MKNNAAGLTKPALFEPSEAMKETVGKLLDDGKALLAGQEARRSPPITPRRSNG